MFQNECTKSDDDKGSSIPTFKFTQKDYEKVHHSDDCYQPFLTGEKNKAQGTESPFPPTHSVGKD